MLSDLPVCDDEDDDEARLGELRDFLSNGLVSRSGSCVSNATEVSVSQSSSTASSNCRAMAAYDRITPSLLDDGAVAAVGVPAPEVDDLIDVDDVDLINDSSNELRNRCGENAEVVEAIEGGRRTLVFDDVFDTTSDGPELERR